MDQLKDILQNNSPKEPPQIQKLKRFLKDTYDLDSKIIVSRRSYLIFAPNAALAHRLRIDSLLISDKCDLDKRLTIRISSE